MCPDSVSPARFDADLLRIRRSPSRCGLSPRSTACADRRACCSRAAARRGTRVAGCRIAKCTSTSHRATSIRGRDVMTTRHAAGARTTIRERRARVALFVTILAMLLLSAIGGSLVLGTISETAIAANFLGGRDVFYAADAALERALADLAETVDWSAVLGGDRLVDVHRWRPYRRAPTLRTARSWTSDGPRTWRTVAGRPVQQRGHGCDHRCPAVGREQSPAGCPISTDR